MGCAGSKNSPKEQRAVSDSQRRREKRERRRRRATSTRDGDGTSHSKDPNSNSNSGGEDSREERRRRKRARRERRERRRLRRQQREAEGGEDTSSPSGGTSATPSPDTVALSRTPPSAALPVTSNEPFAEEQLVAVPTSAVVVVAGAAAAATTTQRGVSAAGSSGHGDSVREAGEEGYVGPGPGPAYAGWRSHSCFTEGNGLLFRLVNGRKKQWAFYNDTKEYEMVVAVVFGNESAVRALGDAQLEVMNAVTGQCQVDLVVPPGETKLFMRGEYNGYTTKYRALPVDDDVPEAGAATANGQEVPAAASAA